MLERKGVQTAAILTDTFRRSGDAMARTQGFADYRYAVISHPISSWDQSQIFQLERQALPAVLASRGLESDDR